MSLHLHSNQNQKYSTKQYSTNVINLTSSNSNRSFQAYRKQPSLQSSRSKAFNMNDEERRIKREHHSLFKQSTTQSALFEKGVKKITPKPVETLKQNKQNSIKKTYHNKETYNVVNPTPINSARINEGGVRRIYLYDQRKQSNPFRNASSSSRKQLHDTNKQSDPKADRGVYIVKKLATHKQAATQWHNSMAQIQFVKKENLTNKENAKAENKEQKNSKKNFKQPYNNAKNKSNLSVKENGITLADGFTSVQNNSKEIDFKHNYYEKYSRLELNKGRHNQNTYLNYRAR